MSRLTKAQILEAPLRSEEVECPEWGGSVLVGEMPVEKRNVLIARFSAADSEGGISLDLEVDLFVAGVLDPEFDPEDATELQKVSGAVLSRVTKRIMAINGLSADSLDTERGNS